MSNKPITDKAIAGYLSITILAINDLTINNLTNNILTNKIKGQKKWHEV